MGLVFLQEFMATLAQREPGPS